MDQMFLVKLEQELNNFKYALHLPLGAPFSDVKEILAHFGAAVEAMEKEAIDRSESAKAANGPVEVEPEPVQEA